MTIISWWRLKYLSSLSSHKCTHQKVESKEKRNYTSVNDWYLSITVDPYKPVPENWVEWLDSQHLTSESQHPLDLYRSSKRYSYLGFETRSKTRGPRETEELYQKIDKFFGWAVGMSKKFNDGLRYHSEMTNNL